MTSEADLVERLNKVESSRETTCANVTTNWYRNPDGPEAAERIQSLSSTIEELKDAAEFAEESLSQLLSDMGEKGQCVCLAAKEEAQQALAAVRIALFNIKGSDT